MTLLAPLALLGLLTLLVIIALHFLRTRREPLLISTLRLWQGLHQKQQNAALRYLPITLLLVLQLCAAAALALGLARPAFSFLLKQPQHTLFILDTTTSMAAQTAGLTRFDAARQVIYTYLQEMGSRDTVTVIGLNRRPAILLSANAQQKEPAQLTLKAVTPGGNDLDLPAALTLANGLLTPDRLNQIIVLTDGAYTVDANRLPSMSIPVTWQLPPAQPSASNQALLNVSTQPWPDGRHRLFARVVNYDSNPVQRTVRVQVDGQPFDEAIVNLAAQAESNRAWTLPAAAQTVVAEIVEPDALTLDNRADLFLNGGNRYRVLLVSNATEAANSPLARALAAQPGVELTLENDIAPGFDLTVLEGQSSTLLDRLSGKVWLVNPPPDAPNSPVTDVRANLATVSNLFTGVDLSSTYFRQVSTRALPDWATIDLTALPLTRTNTTLTAGTYPLVFHGSVNNSEVVVWAFDLNKSNLSGRLALPLLTANTLAALLSTLPQPVTSLGEPVTLNSNLSVETPGGQRLSLAAPPAAQGLTNFTRTETPGLYRVFNNSNQLVGGFAVHAGSPLESNLAARFQPNTLPNLTTAAALTPAIQYYEIWPWLAGLALLLITVEGWLAWKK